MIRTFQWRPQWGKNSIAGVMAGKTNLKKIIFSSLLKKHYEILRRIIDPEWEIEGEIRESMEDVTIIHRANNNLTISTE